jgi:hyaluronoglucosaminidase
MDLAPIARLNSPRAATHLNSPRAATHLNSPRAATRVNSRRAAARVKRAGVLAALMLGACASPVVSLAPEDGGSRMPPPAAATDGAAPPPADAAVDAAPGCPPGPAVTMASPAALAIYPAVEYAALDALGARVKTACVDTSALSSHATLDALVPSLLAGAELSPAPNDCSCDYSLAFTASAPALTAAAATAWSAAGTNPERYAMVTTSQNGRASAALYALEENAALYALRAALALVEPDPSDAGARRVAEGTIVDYPAFGARGVVEGIYGPNTGTTVNCGASSMTYLPWHPGDRAAVLEQMSLLRENVFIYGPKCDPYARSNWPAPYPPGSSDEAVIRVALHDAESRLVKFVWSISPGLSYDFGSPAGDFAKVTSKIDHMRALGVSHFALFLDDISNGTAAEQVTLANGLEDYIQQQAPTEHLIMVGTTYWAGPNPYTDQLGTSLHGDIEVMWTGNDVEPSTMTSSDMTAINASLKRHATIWDNWPNTPGSFNGRSGDLVNAVQGYYSNPVLNEYPGPAHPPSTFYAVLGPIADYLWDPTRYDKSPSTSYSTWQPILSTVPGASGCAPCGANVPGWTCGAVNQIEYCDFDTHCLSTHACPGGCVGMPSGVPDLCQ